MSRYVYTKPRYQIYDEHEMKIERIIIFIAYLMMTSANMCFIYLPKKYYSYFNQASLSKSLDNCISTIRFVEDTTPSSIETMQTSLRQHLNGTHISFLSALISVPTQYFAKQNMIDLYWDMYIHSKEDDTHHTSYQLCNKHYIDALKLLSQHLHRGNAAIITTSAAGCFNSAARDLYNQIKTTESGIKDVSIYELPVDYKIDVILQTIYQIKLNDISIIFLFLDSTYTDILWQVSTQFGLNRYEHLWITIETSDHLRIADYLPWQHIDVREDKSEIDAESLQQVVTNVFNQKNISSLRTYDMLSNTTLLSSIYKNITIYARDLSLTNKLKMLKTLQYCNRRNLEILPDAKTMSRLIDIPTFKTKLKIVTIIDPPFTILARHLYIDSKRSCSYGGLLCMEAVLGIPEGNAYKWQNTCCIGLIMDLLSLISTDLHFEFDIYIVEDGYYGGLSMVNNTYQWNGLVQDIYLQKADIAMAALTQTVNRSNSIDFTEPFMKTDISLIASTIAAPINFINWEFISPLESTLRWWLVGTFIIGTVLIYILENQVLVLKRITDKTAHARYQWREGFSYFSGLTFQRDLGGKNPQKAGARVTAIAFAFGMVIIMTTYTAVLTASKVSQENSNLFLGFADQKISKPDHSFTYATVEHSSIQAFFKHSPDPVHQTMYLFMREFNVNTTAEGVELVKNKRLDAFISETPLLVYQRSANCTLKIYGKSIAQNGYAFMVPAGSPWKDLLSQSILKFKRDEIISDIERKWFPAICESNSTTVDTYESVEINYFGGLILVLCSFFIISFALLGIEYFCHRHHRRVINPIQDKVQVWRETKAAGRRNAIIDPRDLSMLQTKLKNKPNEEEEDDVDSVISEGEEELIRMRMMQNNRRMSRAKPASFHSDTFSVATTTSSAGSTATFSQAVLSLRKRMSTQDTFDTVRTGRSFLSTLEVIEASEISESRSLDDMNCTKISNDDMNKDSGIETLCRTVTFEDEDKVANSIQPDGNNKTDKNAILQNLDSTERDIIDSISTEESNSSENNKINHIQRQEMDNQVFVQPVQQPTMRRSENFDEDDGSQDNNDRKVGICSEKDSFMVREDFSPSPDEKENKLTVKENYIVNNTQNANGLKTISLIDTRNSPVGKSNGHIIFINNEEGDNYLCTDIEV